MADVQEAETLLMEALQASRQAWSGTYPDRARAAGARRGVRGAKATPSTARSWSGGPLSWTKPTTATRRR